MIDEFGKANPAVKNALLRLISNARSAATHCTPTLLCSLRPTLALRVWVTCYQHTPRIRITVVETKKPAAMSWVEWGISNGVDHSILGWVKDNPQTNAGLP